MTFKQGFLFAPNQPLPISILDGKWETIEKIKGWMLEVFDYVSVRPVWLEDDKEKGVSYSGTIRINIIPDSEDTKWAVYSAVGMEAIRYPHDRATMDLSSVYTLLEQVDIMEKAVKGRGIT